MGYCAKITGVGPFNGQSTSTTPTPLTRGDDCDNCNQHTGGGETTFDWDNICWLGHWINKRDYFEHYLIGFLVLVLNLAHHVLGHRANYFDPDYLGYLCKKAMLEYVGHIDMVMLNNHLA